ncbi:MAG: DNA repair protein RecO [Firmicutes bacterium]|nr:DNA repair protein RecO [Bacillota bacterium]
MIVKCEGIVLKQIKFKDNDKILTIFTKDNGKIQAIAKGARKPKSKLIASTQLFCYSNFVAYKGKNFYNINQGEIVESFYPIREDLNKLAYATYVMELVYSATAEEEVNTKLFGLILKTMKLMAFTEIDLLKLIRAFEIKYISFLGYKPHLKNCVNCNGQLNKEIRFSLNYGGILCKKCKRKDKYAFKISTKIFNTLNRLLYCHLDELSKVNIDKESMKKIEKILIKYILKQIDRNNFKSLDFINTLK